MYHSHRIQHRCFTKLVEFVFVQHILKQRLVEFVFVKHILKQHLVEFVFVKHILKLKNVFHCLLVLIILVLLNLIFSKILVEKYKNRLLLLWVLMFRKSQKNSR